MENEHKLDLCLSVGCQKEGKEQTPTMTNTVNEVGKVLKQESSSSRQSQLAGLGRSCCPVQCPCQLALAEGTFSEWERPQTDLAGLQERSQTAGRGLVPMGCVPAAAGTSLSQNMEQTHLLGGSFPVCCPSSPRAVGLNS